MKHYLQLLCVLSFALTTACTEEEVPCACALDAALAGAPQPQQEPFIAGPIPPFSQNDGFRKATEYPDYRFLSQIGDHSFKIIREALNRDELPPYWLIAPSEVFNHFTYDLPKSTKSNFVQLEVHPAPWNSKNRLVRIFMGMNSTEIDIKLTANTLNILKYRVISRAVMEEQPRNSNLPMSSAKKEPDQAENQSTFFIEVELRSEVKTPVENLHLFDLEINSEKYSVEDTGQGELTASRDFQFSAGLTWWTLIVTEQIAKSYYLGNLIQYIEGSLSPDTYPEREDILPLIEKFQNLWLRSYQWECVYYDPYPYSQVCDCQ